MRNLLILMLFIVLTEPSNAQDNFSFNCRKDTTIECTNSCLTLKTVIPNIYSSSTSYAVNQISALSCFRGYVNPAAPGQSANLIIDDRYSPELNIGFKFPFYGINYEKVIASTNGFISFDVSKTGKFSHFGILRSGTSLSATSGTPENLPSQLYDRAIIMGPYHDLDPNNAFSSQQIKYDVVGTAPYRKWILSYYNVPLYTTACPNIIKNTHQIVLYETLGIVEVFIYDKEICLNWNNGRSMIGMQDFNKTSSVMAPGREASNAPWGSKSLNESWRFVPAGGSSLFKRAELYTIAGVFVATGSTTSAANNLLNVNFANICPPSSGQTYVVKSFYKNPINLSEEIIGTDTINVSRGDPISVNLDPATCAKSYTGTITITSPVGSNYEYSIDGNSWQTSTVFTLPSGNYTLRSRIIGSNCISNKSVTIDVESFEANVKKVITPCPAPLTAYIEIFPIHGTAPYLYSLNGGAFQTSNIFTGLKEGEYKLIVKDAVGCTYTTPVFINSTNLVDASVTNTICGKAPSGTITVTPNFGKPPYNFSINGGSFQSSNIFSNLAGGNYNIVIQDSTLCTYPIDVTIGSDISFFVNPNIKLPACFGNKNGTITINPSQGQAPYLFAMDDTSYQSNNVFANLAAGNYLLHVKDFSGCIKDTTVIVNQPNPVNGTPVVTPAATCLSYDGQVTIKANGGTVPYMYSIDSTKTFQLNNMFNVAAGVFSIVIKDSNNCTATISDTVTAIDKTLIVDLGPDKTICSGSSTTITVNTSAPSNIFNTQPAAGLTALTSQTVIANPIDTTTYVVYAKTAVCVGADSITINVLHKPIANAGADTAICNNTFATLRGSATNVSGSISYLWVPSKDVQSPNSSTTIVRPSKTHTNIYRLQVSDNYGCNFKVFDEVKIFMNESFKPFAGNDTIAAIGLPHQLFGSGGIEYLWSPSSVLNNPLIPNPVATLQNDTKFNLIAKDSMGCIGTSSVNVKVYKGPTFYIPNAFTPNNDGLNDFFKAVAPGIKTNFFRIFNRWGQLMFQTQDVKQGWDGKYAGVPQPTGVYVWVIKGLDDSGKIIELKGTVTLIR